MGKTATHAVRELFLVTTGRCNLSCRYCSADANSVRRDLDPDIAEQAVRNWILTSEASRLSLVFTGGEPLLWGLGNIFRICEAARAAAKSRNSYLHLGIQTNGTLIDADFIKLCDTMGVQPSISLDGPPEISDLRRGAAHRALDGINRIQAAGIPFALISCLTRELALNIDRALAWYLKNRFLKVRINAVGAVPPPRTSDKLSTGEIFTAKRLIAEHLFRYREAGVQEYNVLRQLRAARQALEGVPVEKNFCDRFNCEAGIRTAALTPDGKYAICVERSLTGALPSTPELRGLRTVSEAFWGKDNPWTDCAACGARAICDYGCPAYHAFEKDLFVEYCDANRKFWLYLVARAASSPWF